MATDWNTLIRAYHAGDQAALAALVAGNDGLVRQLAASFGRSAPHVDLDDLIQEGRMALLDAARCFRPDQGWAFNSYAGDCVRRRMVEWVRRRSVRPLGPQESDPDSPPALSLLKSRHDEPGPPDLLPVVAEYLSLLSERELRIVRLRHGLDGDRPLPFAAIGSRVGLSRERVERLYATAMLRLRAASVRRAA